MDGLCETEKAQFYASAQNLFTITNYSGMDPEVGGGVDIGFYPQARTYILGAVIDFNFKSNYMPINI